MKKKECTPGACHTTSMHTDRKKQLKNAYKDKPAIGGVCCIRCSGNQRAYLQASRNIEGLRNRFDFAISMGTCPDPSLRGEWEKYGSGSFTFTVLDEIQKGETQSDKDFADDIDALYEMWLERSQRGELV